VKSRSVTEDTVLTDPALRALMDEISKNIEILLSEPSIPPVVKPDVKGKSPSSGDTFMALMDVEIVASEPSFPPAVNPDVKGKSPSSGDKLMALMDVEIVASEPSIPPPVDPDVNPPSEAALTETSVKVKTPTLNAQDWPEIQVNLAKMRQLGCDLKVITTIKEDYPELKTRNQSISIAMIPSDQLHPKGADSKQDLPCFEIPSKSHL
jgi:hypothetical protein